MSRRSGSVEHVGCFCRMCQQVRRSNGDLRKHNLCTTAGSFRFQLWNLVCLSWQPLIDSAFNQSWLSTDSITNYLPFSCDRTLEATVASFKKAQKRIKKIYRKGHPAELQLKRISYGSETAVWSKLDDIFTCKSKTKNNTEGFSWRKLLFHFTSGWK